MANERSSSLTMKSRIANVSTYVTISGMTWFTNGAVERRRKLVV